MNRLDIVAPQAQPRSDWTPITKLPTFGEGRSFISGDVSGNRIRMTHFYREADQTVCTRAWFGWAAEGPPGHAHGGSILAVFDEAMGMAVYQAGYLALAASVTGQFRNKIPLGTDAIVESKVVRTERRKVYAQAKIVSPDDETLLFAEAEGLYVMLRQDQIEASGMASDR